MANITLLLSVSEHFGIPVAVDKLEGACSVITFLGIELDTIQELTRLPTHKLEELQSLITALVGRKSCLKWDLKALVGKLQHACKVVKPACTFLRRMFELLCRVSKKHHHIRLHHAFCSDLMQWHTFLGSWSGKATMHSRDQWIPAVEIYTNAAGEVGCGAWWGVHSVQLKWARAATWRGILITQKEVLPAVFACVVWGHQWKAKRIWLYCHNAAAVAVLNAGYSHDPLIMQLLRSLIFVKAYFWPGLKGSPYPRQG